MTAPRVAALACALVGALLAPAGARAQLHLSLEAGSFAGDDVVFEDYPASKLGSATVLGARVGYSFRLGAGNGFGVDLGWRRFQSELVSGRDHLGTLEVTPVTLGLFYSYRPPSGRGLGGRMGMGYGLAMGPFKKGPYFTPIEAGGTTVRVTQHTGDHSFEVPMALEYFFVPYVSAGLQLRLMLFTRRINWYTTGPYLFPGDTPGGYYGDHKSGRDLWVARHDLGVVLRFWLP